MMTARESGCQYVKWLSSLDMPPFLLPMTIDCGVAWLEKLVVSISLLLCGERVVPEAANFNTNTTIVDKE